MEFVLKESGARPARCISLRRREGRRRCAARAAVAQHQRL